MKRIVQYELTFLPCYYKRERILTHENSLSSTPVASVGFFVLSLLCCGEIDIIQSYLVPWNHPKSLSINNLCSSDVMTTSSQPQLSLIVIGCFFFLFRWKKQKWFGQAQYIEIVENIQHRNENSFWFLRLPRYTEPDEMLNELGCCCLLQSMCLF